MGAFFCRAEILRIGLLRVVRESLVVKDQERVMVHGFLIVAMSSRLIAAARSMPETSPAKSGRWGSQGRMEGVMKCLLTRLDRAVGVASLWHAAIEREMSVYP